MSRGVVRGLLDWVRGLSALMLAVAVLVALWAIPVASAGAASPGDLYAFGDNFYGQLGIAATSGTGDPNPTPALVSLPGQSGSVVQVAVGANHSLAVTSSGQLYAFGLNYYGQLGTASNNSTFNASSTPGPVSLPGQSGPVVQVAAGDSHSLAVTSSGQLYGFGYNGYGQLGSVTNTGTGHPNPTPALVSLPGQSGPVVQVAAGSFHTLVVTSSGQLYAFGDNRYGQLGSASSSGSPGPNPTPTLVSLPGQSGPVVQVAAGANHSLAVTSSGQLYAFGYNGFGQLGSASNSGTNTPNPTPALVSLPGQSGPVVQVAAGGDYSLAVTSSGQLYAFGNNGEGELGSVSNSGTNNSNPTPALVAIAGGASIDTVARGAAASHTLVVVAQFAVSSGSLPAGAVGSPYRATVQATGGATPYRWSASGLAPGLGIDGSSGQITGIPTRAGSYTVTVTATDHDGIVASRSLPLTISAVKLTGLRVSPRTLTLTGRRVHGHCVSITVTNRSRPRCKRKLNLRIAYALSGAATVSFTLKRVLPGREVNGRCVTPSKHNNKHKHCTRLKSLTGHIMQAGNAGANSLTLTGNLGGHTLNPGNYQLTATPIGGSGQTAQFTIRP